MKHLRKKYRALSRLACVLLVGAFLTYLHQFAFAILLVSLFQLMEFAMCKRSGFCYIGALTPDQVKEFEKLMTELGGEWDDVKTMLRQFPEEKKRHDELRSEVKKLQKRGLMNGGQNGVRLVGTVPTVSEDCARAFAAVYIGCAIRQEKWNSKRFGDADEALVKGADWLGVEKAALASTDIPLPTIYASQVIELVYQFGQFRQFSTIFPLGAGTVNLPQLKPGEDVFSFIGVGTAGMSQAVGEKKVAAQNVTFTANKCGGIIRIPSEIEEDTFIPLGQFLARYVARNFALLEDKTGFLGDGSGTYANIRGVGPFISNVAQTPQLQQLAAGKTKPTDATLNDFRAMRTLVNAAVLQMGTAAYYMHPSMEALLVSFNTIGSPLIYRPQNGNQPATLDGFPIHWVGVMQPYSTKAAANAYLSFFGDLSYWYLGERGSPRVETSREVYFATDEIGMRALERIDVEAMAPDAMSALQTAAA